MRPALLRPIASAIERGSSVGRPSFRTRPARTPGPDVERAGCPLARPAMDTRPVPAHRRAGPGPGLGPPRAVASLDRIRAHYGHPLRSGEFATRSAANVTSSHRHFCGDLSLLSASKADITKLHTMLTMSCTLTAWLRTRSTRTSVPQPGSSTSASNAVGTGSARARAGRLLTAAPGRLGRGVRGPAREVLACTTPLLPERCGEVLFGCLPGAGRAAPDGDRFLCRHRGRRKGEIRYRRARNVNSSAFRVNDTAFFSPRA